MNDARAALYGLLPCKRQPNRWHRARYSSPPCDCGACANARSNGKRPPHRRCHCHAKSKDPRE